MTKERLRQYRELKNEKAQIEEKLEELEGVMYAPRGTNYEEKIREKYKTGSLTEVLHEQHEALVNLYNAKLAELNALLLEIETAVESLTDATERRVVRLHYIDGMKWEAVAVAIGYEWAQTHRIHARALAKLRELEEVKNNG